MADSCQSIVYNLRALQSEDYTPRRREAISEKITSLLSSFKKGRNEQASVLPKNGEGAECSEELRKKERLELAHWADRVNTRQLIMRCNHVSSNSGLQWLFTFDAIQLE